MFLIRTAFWLGLVVLLIPVNPADLGEGQQPVSTIETVGAAQDLLADFIKVCDRKPEACEKGKLALSRMGLKAKEGARIVYSFLDDKTASAGTSVAGNGAASDMVTTGSVN